MPYSTDNTLSSWPVIVHREMIQLRFHFQASWSRFLLWFDARTDSSQNPTAPVRVSEQREPMQYGGYVAGLRFYDGPDILPHLRPGLLLRMVRDRYNPHDANAIRLMIGEYMLGYIPRGPNTSIAARMDRAEAMICRIERVHIHSSPWRQVEISIQSTPRWSDDAYPMSTPAFADTEQ